MLTLLTSCSKPTINGAPLPEFYGLFAIDRGKLFQIKAGDIPDLSENTEFLLFDKRVAFGTDDAFFSISFDTKPHPADDGSFSWDKFNSSIEAFRRASQAALTGIPEGAVRIETLKKPVESKPEMLRFAPATPFKPGMYQLGGAVKFWVEREKYTSAIQASARQAMQSGNWVDASRYAAIALIVQPADPKLTDEFNMIKFGSLVKGATAALDRENFDAAAAFAKRGQDLQPPAQFGSQFTRLLDVDIPYQKVMKSASAASKAEEWDELMQAGEDALRLKPEDPKATTLLASCPKVHVPDPCYGVVRQGESRC
jgi:hypothetical protein